MFNLLINIQLNDSETKAFYGFVGMFGSQTAQLSFLKGSRDLKALVYVFKENEKEEKRNIISLKK